MKNFLKSLFLVFSYFICQFILTSNIRAESSYSVIINEVMPNPAGSDTEFEWIELYNFGRDPLQLSTFKLDEVTLPSYQLESNQYIIVAKNSASITQRYAVNSIQSNFSLNNTSDTVQLKTIEGVLVDSISYTTSHEEKSLERKGTKSTAECIDLIEHTTSSSINLKNENYIESCNEIIEVPDPVDPTDPIDPEPPVDPEDPITISSIEFSTDAVEWSEQLSIMHASPIFFRYTMSDPAVTVTSAVFTLGEITLTSPHTFAFGNFTVSLTVTLSDGTEISKQSQPLQIIPQTIVITEIYPSPASSSGESEWIEVYNYGDTAISLKDWYVRDKGTQADGFGTTKGTFSDITINPHTHYVLSQPALKVTLNNSGDTIGIFNAQNELIDSQEYLNTPTGNSFSLPFSTEYANSDLQLTQTSTPNTYSIITNETEEPEEEIPIEEEIPEEIIAEISIKKAKALADDTKIKVVGCTSLVSNLFTQKTTYLQDETGGIQISNLDKLIPIDKKVEVLGTIDTAYKARKLKAVESKIIGDCNVSVQLFSANEIIDQEGMLVEVTGTVVKKFQNGFDLMDEKENTIRITIKESTSIMLTEIQKGKKVSVAGILTKYNDSFRILPREESDIVVFDDEEVEEEVIETSVSSTAKTTSTKTKPAVKIASPITVSNSSKILGVEAKTSYRLPELSSSLLQEYESSEPKALLLPILIILFGVVAVIYLCIIRIDRKLILVFKMLFPSSQSSTNYFARKVTN